VYNEGIARRPPPPAVSPIEDILRAADWQLAVLVVALVVLPGALDQIEAAHRLAPEPIGDVPRATKWSVRGRHVRPPRSC
jgi:hypothetical protein